MEIRTLPQRSDEWFEEKRGKPSASNFDKIVKMDGKPSASQAGYMYELAAEAISGRHESFTNQYIEEGIRRESESRIAYELRTGRDVTEVGLVYHDSMKYLCSPDGLIYEGEQVVKGLELKNPAPKTQIEYLDKGFPSKYFQQVQGSLLVTGLELWDFMSYCPGLPIFLVTVTRDEGFIRMLAEELERFSDKLDKLINKLMEGGYGN